MLTSLILGLLAQAPAPVTPDPAQVPTLNVTTVSSYGNGTLTWDAGTSRWVGCLSKPFQYNTPGRICGTTSGTAIVRVELERSGIVTLRWNAAAGGLCAVDGNCNGPMPYANRQGYHWSTTPFKLWTTYSPLGGNLPPFWGQATVTITAP